MGSANVTTDKYPDGMLASAPLPEDSRWTLFRLVRDDDPVPRKAFCNDDKEAETDHIQQFVVWCSGAWKLPAILGRYQ